MVCDRLWMGSQRVNSIALMHPREHQQYTQSGKVGIARKSHMIHHVMVYSYAF
jgi:hypothetical protein